MVYDMRVGRAMAAVLRYVDAHPGATVTQAADAANPDNRRAGYYAVERTIRRGLVRATAHPRGPRSLTLSLSGRAIVRQLDSPPGGDAVPPDSP